VLYRVNTALWVGGSVLIALLAVIAGWRLRRAARTVDRILAEEAERTGDEDETMPNAPEDHRAAGG
jgi:hypothetical protein